MSNYKFRKKPVVIEAFQMTLERRLDNQDWPSWLHIAWNKDYGANGCLQISRDDPSRTQLEIVTLEGWHKVTWGDWIIQGVQGELYPCKPDIFATTYEEATNDTETISHNSAKQA